MIFIFVLYFDYSGSWASQVEDINQWIQVEFNTPFKIAAIQTQGRSDASNQWVTSYKLSYGYDGISWNDANGNEEGDMVNLMYQSHSIIVLITFYRI